MKTIKVSGFDIEIFHKDIETAVDWKTAMRRADRFHDGSWRLPTISELAVMNSLFNLGVGNFRPVDYWSSDVVLDNELVWSFEINYGSSAWPWKSSIEKRHAVRPVRDIISK